jgi:hypothetical protein
MDILSPEGCLRLFADNGSYIRRCMMPRKGLTEARAQRAREREEKRKKAIQMRLEGCTFPEIEKALGIRRSTIFEWTKEVKVPPEVEQARRERVNRAKAKQLYTGHMDGADELRRSNYLRGRASEPTDEDLYCIGQYGGEGQKARNNGIWSPRWVVVNADFEFIRRMIGYAIRAGQEPFKFHARIHVHEDLEASDDEVKAHWAAAGIPVEEISIFRVKSKREDTKPRRTLTWGTCILDAIDNGVGMFWYWCGQYDQLLERSDGQPEFLPLLNQMRDEEQQRKEEHLARTYNTSETSDA